jgi:tetratricopeptide (TPR) repeat protein
LGNDRFFDLKADWQNWEQTHLLALEAAYQLDDRAQQAQILNSLANAYVRQGYWNRAKQRYDRALKICTLQAMTAQEAQTLINLGIVCELQRQTQAALGFWRSAIERLPAGSLEREKVGNWMRSTSRLPLQTALEELGTSANSHQILHAVGGAIKWLLHPGGLNLWI